MCRKKVTTGVNDLKTLRPLLANEWNNERNDNITSDQCSVQSNKRVWWRCEHGHEWQERVYARINGNSCPFCSGRKAIPGINDLETVNPQLIKEWDYERNGKLMPNSLLPKSNKKVWWKCSNNHSWKASIDHRSNGTGCPYC